MLELRRYALLDLLGYWVALPRWEATAKPWPILVFPFLCK
jgi:hypothetical protein